RLFAAIIRITWKAKKDFALRFADIDIHKEEVDRRASPTSASGSAPMLVEEEREETKTKEDLGGSAGASPLLPTDQQQQAAEQLQQSKEQARRYATRQNARKEFSNHDNFEKIKEILPALLAYRKSRPSFRDLETMQWSHVDPLSAQILSSEENAEGSRSSTSSSSDKKNALEVGLRMFRTWLYSEDIQSCNGLVFTGPQGADPRIAYATKDSALDHGASGSPASTIMHNLAASIPRSKEKWNPLIRMFCELAAVDLSLPVVASVHVLTKNYVFIREETDRGNDEAVYFHRHARTGKRLPRTLLGLVRMHREDVFQQWLHLVNALKDNKVVLAINHNHFSSGASSATTTSASAASTGATTSATSTSRSSSDVWDLVLYPDQLQKALMEMG
ncbi:unnamed protein product, partial [Amoebophrya sp. A25]